MNKMKKRKTFLRFAAAALAAISLAASTACAIKAAPIGQNISGKVMLICKNKNVSFWYDIGRGAEEAGSEIGLDIDVRYADSETDFKSQQGFIDEAINGNYKAIIIAPNTPSSGSFSEINSKLAEAASVGKTGIPIININNAIKYEGTDLNQRDVSMLIKSDDEEGGRTAARAVIDLLKTDNDRKQKIGGNGKFLVFGHASGTGTTRCEGFQDELANAIAAESNENANSKQGGSDLSTLNKNGSSVSDINQIKLEYFDLVLNVSSAGFKDAIEKDILTVSKLDELSAIFCTNTETTETLCEAIETAINTKTLNGTPLSQAQINKLEKLIVIGFNSSETEQKYIESGRLSGTIVQNPYLMGYLSVRYVKQILQGKSVPTDVDPGIMYVDKAKLGQEYVQKMIVANADADEESDE
ncbi:MAG: substrate-binding domain-containing protein [Ruminococcus sp.]|nr:substrate-binding domain-containing protein [Ruminococcus sp.]